jgi:CheY-like chemotaxis protein
LPLSPTEYVAPQDEEEEHAEFDPDLLLKTEVEDDRHTIDPGDRVVLIVEDDVDLAKTELQLARRRGFKGIVATRGDFAVALAHEYHPDAIILDVKLPVQDGWQVLEHLKRNSETRHIPVHIVSGTVDEQRSQEALRSGAVAVLVKPVGKEQLEDAFASIAEFHERVRSLLVVDDDEMQRNSISELIGGGDDVEIVGVGSSEEALELLERRAFDCMVLDLKLPKMSGFKLLEKVKTDERFHSLPVIVYTGRELTRREETRLKKYAETIIVKDVRSPERLLDETALFLHRVEAKLPEDKRKMLEQLHSADAALQGRKVLIADDDVRNVFALASVLERHGVEVLFAENGHEAIAALEASPGVDLVLMDIMMPELDGYEATRRIRADKRFAKLPIISLTAKAMKGDREKSIESGASDYITKPVETDRLLSLMRVWLYR